MNVVMPPTPVAGALIYYSKLFPMVMPPTPVSGASSTILNFFQMEVSVTRSENPCGAQ